MSVRYHTRVLVLAVFVLAALPAGVALAKKALIDVSGTSWYADVTGQLKVQKLGSEKYTTGLELYLGASSVPSLGDGEFMIVDEDNNEYTGTWSVPKGNGNLVTQMDTDSLAVLTDNLTSDLTDALDQSLVGQITPGSVWVDITGMKLQITLKPGKSGSLSMTVNFNGGATVDGKAQTGKGSMTAKGKVNPA